VTREVLVVGAGMAGLTAATERAAAGDRVTVVDKGRRPGGRMATRRVEGVPYATGAPSFAAGTDIFRAAIRTWETEGHVAPDPDGAGRWRGRPTMRDLPTALADALADRSGTAIHLASTVTGLRVEAGSWQVTLTEGDDTPAPSVRRADVLVLTAPAPQTLALLDGPGAGLLAAQDTLARLAAVAYTPCLAVLVRPVTSDPSVAPRTILADAAFSATHLDGDRAAAAQELADEESSRLGVRLEVLHVHGWRYAQVATGIDAPALRDDTAGAPLVLAGDLFIPGGTDPGGTTSRGDAPEGVERAYLSGLAAAALLDDMTGRG